MPRLQLYQQIIWEEKHQLPLPMPTCPSSGKVRYSRRQANRVCAWWDKREAAEQTITSYKNITYQCKACGGWHHGRWKKSHLERLLGEIRVLSQA